MAEEKRRIVSIDALRGLDMLLLCGGAATLHLFLAWGLGDTAPQWLMQQFTHADWGGAFTCWDLVMPLFIFITGASMPFAFAKYREKGGPLWQRSTTRRVLRRVALLFVLGMLVQGNLASANPAQMSLFCNTLQAIAIGHQGVFRLGGWSPHIPTGFHVSGGTLDTAGQLKFSHTRLSLSVVDRPMSFC